VRRRLVLVVAATTTLVMVAFAFPLAALVRDVARDRAIAAAERDSTALAPVLAATDEADLIEAAVAQTATGADGRLAVFRGPEQLGDPTPPDDPALSLARDQGRGFSRDTDGGAELYTPVITGDGDTTVVRARVPATLLRDGVTTAWLALAAVGLALVAAGCVLADRLARSLTRDATDLADTARAIAGGAASARARPGGVPEIADVALALNSLADRIDQLRAAERERVADLSHRLRTPLTALRLEADRTGIATLTEGIDRLERDITRLVRDARRPLHDGLVDETCDLAEVVGARAAFWDALAQDDGRDTETVMAPGPLPVRIAEDELVAAVDAVMDNVFSHTPDGTDYEIRVDRRGDRVQLIVRDHGPGAVDVTVAGERGASSAGSSGLGLDIVRHAATSAGGTVDFGTAPGGGFRVVFDLPLADRA
jgi:signal transduction histidine kinase